MDKIMKNSQHTVIQMNVFLRVVYTYTITYSSDF